MTIANGLFEIQRLGKPVKINATVNSATANLLTRMSKYKEADLSELLDAMIPFVDKQMQSSDPNYVRFLEDPKNANPPVNRGGRGKKNGTGATETAGKTGAAAQK